MGLIWINRLYTSNDVDRLFHSVSRLFVDFQFCDKVYVIEKKDKRFNRLSILPSHNMGRLQNYLCVHTNYTSIVHHTDRLQRWKKKTQNNLCWPFLDQDTFCCHGDHNLHVVFLLDVAYMQWYPYPHYILVVLEVDQRHNL